MNQKFSGIFNKLVKSNSHPFSYILYQIGDVDPADIEDLFEELEDLSDSGPDLDTLSILSTPKPSLRPFFSSSRTNMIHEGLSGLLSKVHPKDITKHYVPNIYCICYRLNFHKKYLLKFI